jgi:hypothetical protein
MTKNVTEQVAQEKLRASLAMGDTRAKAEKYAQQVRDYDRAQGREGAKTTAPRAAKERSDGAAKAYGGLLPRACGRRSA